MPSPRRTCAFADRVPRSSSGACRRSGCILVSIPILIVFDTMKSLRLVLLLALPALCYGQTPDLAQSLRFRLAGPFRGGRVVAVTGVPSQPNVFYFGGVGGGVWKTTDGGGTWQPIPDGPRSD